MCTRLFGTSIEILYGYGEDAANVGTFTYRLKGFDEQPTDHYMRTFYKREAKFHKPWCWGSDDHHETHFRYVEHFWDAYPVDVRNGHFNNIRSSFLCSNTAIDSPELASNSPDSKLIKANWRNVCLSFPSLWFFFWLVPRRRWFLFLNAFCGSRRQIDRGRASITNTSIAIILS